MSKKAIVIQVTCNGKNCKRFTELTVEPDQHATIEQRLEASGWLPVGDLDFCPACKPRPEKKV